VLAHRGSAEQTLPGRLAGLPVGRAAAGIDPSGAEQAAVRDCGRGHLESVMPARDRESTPLPGPRAPALLNDPVDLVLHIGSGKTGTSSIQHFLKKNRGRLADLGTLVPQEPGTLRHVQVGLYIKPDEALGSRLVWQHSGFASPAEFREDFRKRLSTEIAESGLSRVLLSDEGVYASSREAMRNLRGLVAEIARTLRLVVYLRRQDDHLCSRYQQSVKTGCVQRLSEWMREDMKGLYDYQSRLLRFDQEVSPTELVVRRFEPGSFARGSLFQDFLDAAGIEARAEDLEQPPDRNQSLDAESVEFLRLLNVHRVEREGATAGQIDNRAYLGTLMKASSGPSLTLPAAALDAFMAQWEDSNRAVAQDFMGDPSGQLFQGSRKTRNTTPEQRLDPDRLPRFFELLALPEEMQAPLSRLAEREAKAA
jgi:hypothetical protein